MAASKSIKKGCKVGRKRKVPVPGDEGLFGQHLADLCERAGLTAEELAEKIGKQPNQVWLYFSGSSLPKMRDYRLIAKVLGLTDGRDILPPLPTKKLRK